jgi:hypothetical protein
MNLNDARTALQSVLDRHKIQGMGLNEHGLGALEMGPVQVYLLHQDEQLHITAPAYVLRDEPKTQRIEQILQAFSELGLQYDQEHNLLCYQASTGDSDVEHLAALITQVAEQAARFEQDLSERF